MRKKAILIDAKDNVATVTGGVVAGETIEVIDPDGNIILQTRTDEDILSGHKIAVKDLDAGVDVVKYGEVIGVTSSSVPAGRWVHTHNVKSVRLDTSK